MRKKISHADIIRIWPTVAAFAQDVGIGIGTARKMVVRRSIPGRYWLDVEQAAAKRRLKTPTGESVTVKLLAEIKAGGKVKRPPGAREPKAA